MLAVAMFFTAAASGETLIIPQGAGTRENHHGSGYPFSGPIDLKSQQVYSNNLFPTLAPGQIFQLESIAFRLNSSGPSGDLSTADFERIEILISSSSGPFTFALEQNHGANVESVFDGPLSLTGNVPPGTTPSAFDLQIEFTKPFFYAPSSGSLIVEVRKYGSDFGFSRSLAAAEIPGVIFYWEDGFGVDSSGNVGLETSISYEVVPEPKVVALAVFGMLVIRVLKGKRAIKS